MQLHTVGFVRPSYIPNMKNNGCGRFSHLCRQCTAHCTTMYATNLPMLSVDSICWAISIVANVFYPLPGITRLRTDSLLQIRDVITSTLMAHNTRTHNLIEMHIQLNALRALMAYWQFINKKKKTLSFIPRQPIWFATIEPCMLCAFACFRPNIYNEWRRYWAHGEIVRA